LRDRLNDWAQRLGRPCFAEDYIDGREFNLSMLAGPSGPEVLPPAEIDFSAFPAGKPRIVGYQAKWEVDSFEYQHTPRRFDMPPSDERLLERLSDLARRTWALFGLAGYARVDFRVDAAGEPWILEINTNPCLSPDAGFPAAVAEAGLSYDAAVERIVADAS
jgi:D-alanine-D-alanine ligase